MHTSENGSSERKSHSANNAFWLVESRDAHRLAACIDPVKMSALITITFLCGIH